MRKSKELIDAELTQDNYNLLVIEYNNLVQVVNHLYDMVRSHQLGKDDDCLDELDD